MNASHTIGETLKYMNSNDIIMDSYWLNLCITVSLVEVSPSTEIELKVVSILETFFSTTVSDGTGCN